MYLLYKSNGEQLQGYVQNTDLRAGDILFAATIRIARSFNRMAETNNIPTVTYTGDVAYIYTSKGWVSHRRFKDYLMDVHEKQHRITRVCMDTALRTVDNTIDKIRWTPYLRH